MAESSPTMMMMYGVAIMHALQSKGSSVDDLLALRDQVHGIVSQQGDLSKGLEQLEREIERRGGGVKSAPPQSGSSRERFMIDIAGVPIAGDQRAKIESRLKDVLLEELAGHDKGGDLVATPLSEMKFGAGLGGATAGMFISGPNLRV